MPTTYEQIDTLLYRVTYSDGIEEGVRRSWTTAIRADQDIAVVAQEQEDNFLIRGDPNAYPQSAADILETTRTQLVQAVRQEGLRRVQAYEPGIKDFDVLKLVADIWPGLNTASLSGDIVTAKDLYLNAKAAITWLKDAARTQLELDAYNITTDPGWSG